MRAARGAGGHTVVEMSIATALLSVVVAAAFGVVIVMQNQAVKTTDRFTAQSEGQTIADRITKTCGPQSRRRARPRRSRRPT